MIFKDSSRQKLIFGESNNLIEILMNRLSNIIFSENWLPKDNFFDNLIVKNVI